jgi:hypothetical protein
MLPISSIVVLYFVSSTLARLAIVVGFTGLFALCLALTKRARRVEVFATTSAYQFLQSLRAYRTFEYLKSIAPSPLKFPNDANLLSRLNDLGRVLLAQLESIGVNSQTSFRQMYISSNATDIQLTSAV